MIVYILEHRRQIDDEYYDTKMIGIYSSQEKVQNTVKEYLSLSGFSQYPNDFNIIPYNLKIKCLSNNTVYLLTGVKLVDDDELTVSYDVYKNKVQSFFVFLIRMITRKKNGAQKFYIERYKINKNEWQEGFVILK